MAKRGGGYTEKFVTLMFAFTTTLALGCGSSGGSDDGGAKAKTDGGGVTAACGASCDDHNPCTLDTCEAAGCRHAPVANGVSCADDNRCNGIEACQNGLCVPGPPLKCDDDNPCTLDVCDPTSGCKVQPMADGTTCGSGSKCRGPSVCKAGTCGVGAAVVCDDKNPCTADTCDESKGGCFYPPVMDGTGCDDLNMCNGREVCRQGVCAAGSPARCDDGNPCTIDSCDPAVGCKAAWAPDGTTCDDGNLCNGHESCATGQCRSGLPLRCDDGNPCTLDRCDAKTGCTSALDPEGSSCDDGNSCNGSETCHAGACQGAKSVNCDDGNPCTADFCDGQAGCRHVPVNDGLACPVTSCVDGATCKAGACVQAAGKNCEDKNPCTADACDAAGNCTNVKLADGTACPDGNRCNGDEICQAGKCQPGINLTCDDNDPCTADSCDKDQGCKHLPMADGATCSDGDACNGDETCKAGVCQPSTQALDCDDKNACTTDSCEAAGGCKHVALADGEMCDSAGCAMSASCTAGICVKVGDKDCDDKNPCTADSCDGTTGECVHTLLANGSACTDDGNKCNGDEVCLAGICKSFGGPDCDDQNPCTTDSCDMVTGCKHVGVADGTACPNMGMCVAGTCNVPHPPADVCGGDAGLAACEDNDPCTVDSCPSGACVHTKAADGTACAGGVCTDGTCQVPCGGSCDDHNPCTTDSCGASNTCVHTPIANGTACADTDPCNGAETCQTGVCAAGVVLDCDDHNPCTGDSCAVGMGCLHTPVPNDTSCTDNNACNGAETCVAGVCKPGTALNCDDMNPCTAEACEPASGCHSVATNEGGSCDVGGGMCAPRTCIAGTCAAALTALSCDDHNDCTADSCDPATGCKHTPMDGLACADNTVCNGAETCLASVCKPGTPLDCNDAVACTTDSCDAVAGCKHLVSDAVCNDSDPCTSDACDAVAGCKHATIPPGTGACPAPAACFMAGPGRVTRAPIANGLAVDAAGNQYVVGAFTGSFDTGAGSHGCGTLTSAGRFDIFVISYDPSGNCRFAKSYGDPTENQLATAVTIDGAGELIVSGTFKSDLDFGIIFDANDGNGPQPVTGLSAGAEQAWVAMFDLAVVAGDATPIWAKAYQLGAGGNLPAMAADPVGTKDFVAVGTHGGQVTATNPPTNIFGCGALAGNATAPNTDVVVAHLATDGTALDANLGVNVPAPRCVWAKRFGGGVGILGDQVGRGVAVDATGNVTLVGTYAGAAFTVTGGTALPTPFDPVTSGNLFAAKLNATGVHVWSKGFGDATKGATNQLATSVALDAAGNAVLVGSMQGLVSFGGTTLTSTTGSSDVLAAALSGTDGATLWAQRWGDGTNAQTANTVLIDGTKVIVGGEFQGSVNFGATGNLSSAGNFDAFVANLKLSDGTATCAQNAGDNHDQSITQVVSGAPGTLRTLGKLVGSINFGTTPATALTEPTGNDFAFFLQTINE